MVDGMGIGHTGLRGYRALGAVIELAFQTLGRRISAPWRRWKCAVELASMNDGRLELLLRDCGLSRAELKAFIVRAPYSRELLDGMLARLKISAEALNRDASIVRNVERHCAVCDAQRRCRRWQAGRGNAQSYHSFCRNAETFDILIDRSRS